MSQVEELCRSDSDLIAAIRKGDRELFRELVERHGQTVFGIAWSRLGDRDLAEEAAQETFIKAYKRLGLLQQSEKFSAWLGAIARHVAINLGIRHRREMDKRERWKLSQPSEPSDADPGQPEVPEAALQQTLARLPAIHRETLVLFYLEGKSIAEAAAAQNISETAFKTRLHRARESMRSALQSSLETSLQNLRPSGRFAAGVMLALPTQAPASLASAGILGTFSKILPFSWMLLCLHLFAVIPGLLLARWMGRKEAENYRDPDGFRAKNLKQMQRSATWFVPAAFMIIFFGLQPISLRLVYPILIAGVALPYVIWSLRRLRLVRNRQIFAEIGVLLLLVFLLSVLQLGWPGYWAMFINGASLACMSVIMERIGLRMDYSLFLRAAQGMLPAPAPAVLAGKAVSREDLFAFARFMAGRNLVLDWRWKGDALLLKLAPVTPRHLGGLFPFVWGQSSSIALATDGGVTARLGASARRDLGKLGMEHEPGILREKVEASVAAALIAFLEKDVKAAEISLGEVPEKSIFHQLPDRTRTARARVWGLRIFAVHSFVIGFGLRHDYWDGGGRSLEVRTFTEPEFRQVLEAAVLEESRRADPQMAFFGPWRNFLFPERQYFSPAALNALHGILRSRIARMHGENETERGSYALLHDELLQIAFQSGLLTTNDFPACGISLPALRPEIESWPAQRREQYLSVEPIQIGQLSYTILNTRELNLRITLLSRLNLLGLFDVSGIVPAIVERQILPESAPDNRWEDLDSKLLHGFFLMIHSNPLRDTCDTLRVLEELGALDQIDREACIRGILRLHEGRGLFIKVPKGNWSIRSNAQDTYCALESLRILGGLDRVKDLETWKFRSARFRLDEGEPPAWETIEAWGLARRAEVN